MSSDAGLGNNLERNFLIKVASGSDISFIFNSNGRLRDSVHVVAVCRPGHFIRVFECT